MEPESGLLLETLLEPERLLRLPPDQQTKVLRQARSTGLLGRLACRVDRLGLYDRCPPKIRDQLLAARVFAREHDRMVRWEVHHILRALRGLDLKPVFLKGAAYTLAGLDVACGRLVSDVDILVSKAQLDGVEKALQSQGWEPMTMDAYDQAYYRKWMHELPPLRHRHRNTVVDIHHSILPETSRLRPDPRLLIGAAVDLGDGRAKTLCPTDTLLHKAAHMFQDGDLGNALGELADLDGLLRAFATDEGFWDALVSRAERLGMMRPLYYGLRYSRRLLGTPVPETAWQAAEAGRPPLPISVLMDLLVESVLIPGDPDRSHPGKALAGWLLYIRSHWLRMPPALLAMHLARKSWRRIKGEKD